MIKTTSVRDETQTEIVTNDDDKEGFKPLGVYSVSNNLIIQFNDVNKIKVDENQLKKRADDPEAADQEDTNSKEEHTSSDVKKSDIDSQDTFSSPSSNQKLNSCSKRRKITRKDCLVANEFYKLRWVKKYTKDIGRFKNHDDALAYFVLTAEMRGGECLEIPSFELIKRKAALWRCSIGHEFSSSISRIQSTTKDDFCQTCFRMKSKRKIKGIDLVEGIPSLSSNLSDEFFGDNVEKYGQSDYVDEEMEQEKLFKAAKERYDANTKNVHIDSKSGSEGEVENKAQNPDPYATDPYKVLGLSAEASDMEIKQRFYELALKYHPDKIKESDNESIRIFMSFRNAYELLLRVKR